MSGFVVANAQLLDPATGERRPGASVRTEGDRIVDVAEDGAALARPADLLLVDGDPLTDIAVLGGQGEHLATSSSGPARSW